MAGQVHQRIILFFGAAKEIDHQALYPEKRCQRSYSLIPRHGCFDEKGANP